MQYVALALKALIPIIGWLMQKSAASDELKRSFFEFVKMYTDEKKASAAAKQTAKDQDADLDAQLGK